MEFINLSKQKVQGRPPANLHQGETLLEAANRLAQQTSMIVLESSVTAEKIQDLKRAGYIPLFQEDGVIVKSRKGPDRPWRKAATYVALTPWTLLAALWAQITGM